jgi:hypothetical protein
LRDGVEAVERVVGHLKVEGRERRTFSGDDAVRGQETEGLHVGRSVGEIIHTFVETSVCCSFDEGTGQIKIVQDFE